MTLSSIAPVVDAVPSAASVVVQVAGLTKRFPVRRGLAATLLRPFGGSRTTVVDNVSFEAHAGEFFGLLGPNGAGKSTLLKMLSTLILPDEGAATVSGFDVVREAESVRAVVSPCLAMERSVYQRLSARQNLEVYADLQGVARQEREARIEEVLAAVSLADTGSKMAGEFSSGMLQRLLIARALLTRPALLLLDEPTRSLDPISAREFRSFLREELVKRRGCAVILATHNAEEAFELCDRVGVLHRGRLLASGVADDLSRAYLGVRYRLTTRQPGHPAIAELPARGVTVLASEQTEGQGEGWHHLILRMDAHHDPSEFVALLSRSGVSIAAFEPMRPSLADLIEGVVHGGGKAS